ncbi:hypothetical protein ACHQM5_020457 [Ranunculus cassubicifolius]
MAMASSFSINSRPPSVSSSRNFTDSLKPIIVNGNPPTFVSAPSRRIVAVGDLHGDLAQTRSALEMAGVLSSDGLNLWTGEQTVLIQLGDILDRGEDEIAILSLLRSLDIQAKSKGGAVFQLNGNHETMNVEGDFMILYPSIRQRQKGLIARSTLLRPGGPLARELARHAVVLKVDDWIFCHGGLLPHHVTYGMERMNGEVSHWMKGLDINDNNGPVLPFMATRGYDSVVWNRLYSRDPDDMEDYQNRQIESVLNETLRAVGAKAMVVGHTPQTAGINCKYSCSIWRIDVGMSSGVLNSGPEVLEIKDNKARVIRSKGNLFNQFEAFEYYT